MVGLPGWSTINRKDDPAQSANQKRNPSLYITALLDFANTRKSG